MRGYPALMNCSFWSNYQNADSNVSIFHPIEASCQWGFFLCVAMGFHVYVLYSVKLDTFYKGHSTNVYKRVERHNSGQENYTRKGIPWQLVWFTEKETKACRWRFKIIATKHCGKMSPELQHWRTERGLKAFILEKNLDGDTVEISLLSITFFYLSTLSTHLTSWPLPPILSRPKYRNRGSWPLACLCSP